VYLQEVDTLYGRTINDSGPLFKPHARFNNKRVNFYNSTVIIPVDVYDKGSTAFAAFLIAVVFMFSSSMMHSLYKIIHS